jgi:hypothetical protein
MPGLVCFQSIDFTLGLGAAQADVRFITFFSFS